MKKRLINCTRIFLLLVFCSTTTMAQNNKGLVIEVQNIRKLEGKILVALYDSEKNFLKNQVTGRIVEVTEGVTKIVFDDILPGEYAVTAFHDINGNNDLDTGLFGIPKEGFGFTNGIRGRFGPPSFAQVKFLWDGLHKEVVVPLQYL